MSPRALRDAARAELLGGLRDTSAIVLGGAAAVLAAGGIALLVLARPGGLVARARSAIGYGTVYALGEGGYDPDAPLPSTDGKCDCSGFAAWVCGLDRRQPQSALASFNGGWLSTDGIIWDARNAGEFFELVSAPAPGDLAVYGDYVGADGVHHEGHVGVLSRVAPSWSGLKMVHCSLGSYRSKGDAIQETSAEFMGKRDTVFVRRTGVSA